jgi:hypothetical protein
MIGSRSKCDRCRDLSRLGTHERVRLLDGPDGERLCPKHHRQAWDELKGETDE